MTRLEMSNLIMVAMVCITLIVVVRLWRDVQIKRNYVEFLKRDKNKSE